MSKVANCMRCKFRSFDFGNGIFSTQIVCKKGRRDFNAIPDEEYKEALEKPIDCPDFESRYIEFPLEVHAVRKPDTKGILTNTLHGTCGQLVKVRPCNPKYENKTYLGILLGEADIGLMISHNSKTKELTIHRHYNPAIFVPELRDIIYGAESWWSKIQSEEELKEISDDDIANVWYVKLLKGEAKSQS